MSERRVQRRRRGDWWVFLAFMALTATIPVGLLMLSDARRDAERQIRQTAIDRAEAIRAETLARAREIQQSRVEVIVRSCREQNRRHDMTLRRLDTLIAELPPDRRARAREGRAGTVALIEALAPKRDCRALARRLLRP